MISSCDAMSEERSKLLIECSQVYIQTKNCINFENFLEDEKLLCQFILDPISLNLPVRVSINDPLTRPEYGCSKKLKTIKAK